MTQPFHLHWCYETKLPYEAFELCRIRSTAAVLLACRSCTVSATETLARARARGGAGRRGRHHRLALVHVVLGAHLDRGALLHDSSASTC